MIVAESSCLDEEGLTGRLYQGHPPCRASVCISTGSRYDSGDAGRQAKGKVLRRKTSE